MVKREIRKEVITLRDSISAQDRKIKDQKIKDTLINLPEFKEAQRILLYASYKSEVDTLGLIKYCLSINKSIALPKVNRESFELQIYEIKDLSEIQPGYQNILEPDVPHDRMLTIKDIDLVIVPGVAFDENCNRLGYGKGCYDKMLKSKEAPLIALAYEEQIVPLIPSEPHDIRMDKIITDERIIVRNGS
ncbi:MAG: 5-formyltetrahydrofolate cyclo-ligase [Thermodesulfovibrionales bacterium]|nr:5-formyltetrahydrofolate cyclo-ligase [Thermodesulfovibrionales bacterium]